MQVTGRFPPLSKSVAVLDDEEKTGEAVALLKEILSDPDAAVFVLPTRHSEGLGPRAQECAGGAQSSRSRTGNRTPMGVRILIDSCQTQPPFLPPAALQRAYRVCELMIQENSLRSGRGDVVVDRRVLLGDQPESRDSLCGFRVIPNLSRITDLS